jgi:hypothetical protein
MYNFWLIFYSAPTTPLLPEVELANNISLSGKMWFCVFAKVAFQGEIGTKSHRAIGET